MQNIIKVTRYGEGGMFPMLSLKYLICSRVVFFSPKAVSSVTFWTEVFFTNDPTMSESCVTVLDIVTVIFNTTTGRGNKLWFVCPNRSVNKYRLLYTVK